MRAAVTVTFASVMKDERPRVMAHQDEGDERPTRTRVNGPTERGRRPEGPRVNSHAREGVESMTQNNLSAEGAMVKG